VELNPNLSTARQALAQALIHFNRPDEAIAQFDEEEKLAPRGFDRFNSLWMRSWAQYTAGRLELALRAVELSLTLNPSYLWALLTKAVCLAELGRHEEARSAIQRLRKLEPNATLDLHLARTHGAFLPTAATATFTATLQKAWDETPAAPAP
jgi:tetratricopeptide (TPR) repeat protein